VQDVKVQYDKANEVAGVTAALTTNTTGNRYVIVTWDAVENVSPNGYAVYYKIDGTKSVVSSGNGSNTQVYAATDGNGTANTDPDKWSYRLQVGAGSGLTAGKSYVFGVRTTALVTTTSTASSDIVWSNAITAP
jgi:hypothetical protein